VVFAVALSCFPGLSTSLRSTTWGLGSWFPLVLVGCFNVGDLLGKSLPARVRLVGRRALPWWTLLHGGYVLLFLLLLQSALPPPPLQVTHSPACEGVCHLRLNTNVKPAC